MSHIDASLLRVILDTTKLPRRLILDTSSSLYHNLRGEYDYAAFARQKSSTQLLESFKLATLIAHEQRHYVDYYLTNYGSWLFRFWPQVKQLIPTLLDYDGRIPVPIRYWKDEVWQKHLNVPLPDALRPIASAAATHSGWLSRDRIGGLTRPHSLSGASQLEALATAYETGPVELHLRPEDFPKVSAALNRDLAHWNDRYVWLGAIFNEFGIGREATEWNTEEFVVDTRLWPAILSAALMGRFTKLTKQKLGEDPDVIYDILPSWRLVRLLKWLVERDGARPSSSEDMWETVNEGCTALFGTNVVEDLYGEIEVMQQRVNDSLKAQSELALTNQIIEMMAHVSWRQRFAELFAADPLKFLDPNRYWEERVPRTEFLLPSYVLVNRKGFRSIPDGLQPMTFFNDLDGAGGRPVFIKPDPPPDTDDVEAEDEILTLISRYFVSGGVSDSWVGPELEGVRKGLEGLQIVVVPPYK